MKKLTALLLVAVMMSAMAFVKAEVRVKLIVDDKLVKADVVTENDRTLVPLRAIMESADAEVKWYEDTKKIDVIKGEKTVTLQIASNVINTVDGDKTLDVAPMIYGEGTTYLPIRAVCEEFGMTVEWDGGTKTVLITSNDASPYVDRYDNMTIEEYAAANNISNEQLAESLLVDYKDIAGMSMTQATKMAPMSEVLKQSGVSEVPDGYAIYGVAITQYMPIGVFEGEMPLEEYFYYVGAMDNYPTPESALADFREYYSLGEEYTLDTKYKFVRTITDIKDFGSGTTEEEPDGVALEAAEKLSELTANKLAFTITMNDGSVMKGELYPDLAPITVENFKKLANNGFYDGLIFHRVIDGFMIQGGGYDKDMKEKQADSIKGEFISNGVANGLSHEKGVISMARTNVPDSASSQFFIMDEAGDFLDGEYAAFGKITEGLDVVNKISEVETGVNELGMTDVPLEPVIIKTITVE